MTYTPFPTQDFIKILGILQANASPGIREVKGPSEGVEKSEGKPKYVNKETPGVRNDGGKSNGDVSDKTNITDRDGDETSTDEETVIEEPPVVEVRSEIYGK